MLQVPPYAGEREPGSTSQAGQIGRVVGIQAQTCHKSTGINNNKTGCQSGGSTGAGLTQEYRDK